MNRASRTSRAVFCIWKRLIKNSVRLLNTSFKRQSAAHTVWCALLPRMTHSPSHVLVVQKPFAEMFEAHICVNTNMRQECSNSLFHTHVCIKQYTSSSSCNTPKRLLQRGVALNWKCFEMWHRHHRPSQQSVESIFCDAVYFPSACYVIASFPKTFWVFLKQIGCLVAALSKFQSISNHDKSTRFNASTF